MDANRLSTTIPTFYRQILDYWYNLQREPTTISDIRNQCLWYNKYIKIDGESFINMEMSNKNINILNDILSKEGALMDTLSIKRDFKLQTNILTLNGLFSAIPRSWKK